MNILVTGGCGFLGSHIVESLGKDNQVTVLDDPSPSAMTDYFMRHTRATFVRGNILHPELDTIFEDHDAVIHLAGKSDVRDSVRMINEFHDVNVRGTLNVLEACVQSGIKKMVFASSSSVYGEKFGVTKETDFSDMQLSPYGATKRMGEILCAMYSKMHGIDIPALRMFTVYGPGGRLNMAMMRFIKQIHDNQPVELHSMDITRDFVYVDDIVDAFDAALSNDVGFETINIGSGKTVGLNHVVEMIEKSMGKQAMINYTSMKEGDVLTTHADISKARKLLGWQPKTSLPEGIQKTVEWYNRHGRELYPTV